MTTETKTKPACLPGKTHHWKLGQPTPEGTKGRCTRCHRTYLFNPTAFTFENYGRTAYTIESPQLPRLYIESEFMDWQG